jgi:acyl-coenzyme A thioesterase PaaI-like protein
MRAAGAPSIASVLMGQTGWADLAVEADPSEPGRFTATIADRWMLVVVPQGGAVALLAARAMGAFLGDATQSLRSMSVVFAGQVAGGPVEIEVQALRRGRSMSQLQATVRNPGAAAGLTAIAVFGAPRRGFDFTELEMPSVPGPDGLRSYRDPVPEGVDFEFDGPPMPFWEEILECRPADRLPPWEPWVPGPAECTCWYRLDDPPLLDDGRLDPLAAIVLCDTMPGAVGEKVGPSSGGWFGPSADFTIHMLGDASPGWLLAHNRARHAGDGYASVEMMLWDPVARTLVASATQVMFFAFR